MEKTSEQVKVNFVPPLTNLEGYVDENGILLCEKFLEYFKNQVNENYINLEKLESANLKTSLNNLSTDIQAIENNEMDILFSKLNEDFEVLYKKLESAKDILLDLQSILSNHLVFCKDLLEECNLGLLDQSLINNVKYFELNSDKFKVHFEEGCNPIFPFSIPHVIELREQIITISNQGEYDIAKKAYIKMKEKSDYYFKIIPQNYPTMIPNFSSTDGEPKLKIGNKNEIFKILISYHYFLSKMNGVRRGWSVLLIRLFDTFDELNCCITKGKNSIAKKNRRKVYKYRRYKKETS